MYKRESAREHPSATTQELGCYSWRTLGEHAPLGVTAIIVCPAHGNTHPIPARGGGPLKPSHSPHPEQLLWPDWRVLAALSPVVTPSSAHGDFLGHGVWLWIRDTQDAPGPSHAYPRRGAEGCVCSVQCVCTAPWSFPIPGVFLSSPRDQGFRAYPGLTRLQGHKRVPTAYLGPQLPERGLRTAVRFPLCAWRLGRTGDPWQRRPAFVSSGSPGSGCARRWDTPLPGSSQPSALMSRRCRSQWLSRNSAWPFDFPGSNLKARGSLPSGSLWGYPTKLVLLRGVAPRTVLPCALEGNQTWASQNQERIPSPGPKRRPSVGSSSFEQW